MTLRPVSYSLECDWSPAVPGAGALAVLGECHALIGPAKDEKELVRAAEARRWRVADARDPRDLCRLHNPDPAP
jgi:hypothetical protein